MKEPRRGLVYRIIVVFNQRLFFYLNSNIAFFYFTHVSLPNWLGIGGKAQRGKGSLPRLGVAMGKQRDNLKKLAI